MNRPSNEIVEAIAPAHDIDGLPISDGYSVRNVAQSEATNTMRLPRGGPHDSTLVMMRRYYDGVNGGAPGHYALLYVEFRAAGSRWRTAGVKVRAEEAARLARDMILTKASKPGKKEPARVAGKVLTVDGSELRAASICTAYVVYVRHRGRTGDWVRTRGVEILAHERPVVAGLLKQRKG